MLRSKTLAALLAVLAVGMICAPVAQGVDSEWLIENRSLSELKLEKEELSLSSKALTLSVPKLATTILCKENAGSGGILSNGTAQFKLTLGECEVVKIPTCELIEPVGFNAKSELIEPGGEFYEKFVPLEGTSFGTLKFTGEECALPESMSIKGAVAATMTAGMKVEHTLEFSKEISEKANAALKAETQPELSLLAGAHTASVAAAVLAALSGASEGEAWEQAGGRVKLCKNNTGNRCPAMENYPAKTPIKAKSEVEILFTMGALQTRCSESWLEGATDVSDGPRLTGTLNTTVFANCTNTSCTVSFPLITTSPYPFYFHLNMQGAPNFVARIEELRFSCGATTCLYRTTINVPVVNGAPATFAAPAGGLAMIRLAGSDGNCAEGGTWVGFSGGATAAAKYKFEKPNPVYVRR